MARLALVAGASRNIGRAVAVRLAQSGLAVAAVARSDAEGLEQTCSLVRSVGGQVSAHLADVSDPQRVRTLVAEAQESWGAVSVLVHTVAIRPRHTLATISLDEWRRVMATNLESLFLLSQAVLPGMVEAGWGRIIGFSGLGAHTGDVPGGVGSASKCGVEGFIRSLAGEYAGSGITANVVLPGGIDTVGKRLEAARRSPPPIGRRGTAAEVAEAVAYFASPESAFTTGQVLCVTGGAR